MWQAAVGQLPEGQAQKVEQVAHGAPCPRLLATGVRDQAVVGRWSKRVRVLPVRLEQAEAHHRHLCRMGAPAELLKQFISKPQLVPSAICPRLAYPVCLSH